jgi:AhpD family alkylhydroperoxidase
MVNPKRRVIMPLDEKTKELVALGAAMAGNCFPCLRYHYKKCRELGIAVDDMRDALEMAKTVKEVPIKNIYELANVLLESGEEIDD